MSQVTLTIGGRKHTVSCGPGQESHIEMLGQMIDAKLQQMGNPAAPDSQNMLFAALLLADELHESKAALLGASNGHQTSAEGSSAAVHDIEPTLERFADLLENCADKLEAQAGSA